MRSRADRSGNQNLNADERMYERQKRQSFSSQKLPMIPKTCVVCGKNFLARLNWQKFCSFACNSIKRKENLRLQEKAFDAWKEKNPIKPNLKYIKQLKMRVRENEAKEFKQT